MRLKNKTAIITGASRGIGRVIALRMAEEGARCALAARSETGLQETARRIESSGGSALAVPSDLTNERSVQNLVDAAVGEFGGVDILIHAVGSIGPTENCEDVSREGWEACFTENLTSVFLMMRAVIPVMKAKRFGRIVSLGSVTGKRPLAQRTPYAAAKMGLIGLTRTLAAEAGPFGITVNVICPGPTEGERVQQVVENMARSGNMTREEAVATFTAPSALKRFVRPEDHAGLCVFLCSEEGRHITGQNLNVSAGLIWY